MNKPTVTAYSELQIAYDHFNQHLFDSSLPECLITMQRRKRTYGYLAFDQFVNKAGDRVAELAMNPSYFAAVPLVEIMQTLCHEMTHLFQRLYGTPGRGRYHNKEWADKMESLGLMPSSTGKPGGARVGDSMADYPIEGGLFLQACETLLTSDFKISWYDRFPPSDAIEAGHNCAANEMDLDEDLISIAADEGLEVATQQEQSENKSNRRKYSCPNCAKTNVWGKPGMSIICGVCQAPFVDMESKAEQETEETTAES